MKNEIALRPSYWASVSGGKDSLYFDFMIKAMRETEAMREKELGRPFSVISSEPKYNADYLDRIVKTKWLHILETRENMGGVGDE